MAINVICKKCHGTGKVEKVILKLNPLNRCWEVDVLIKDLKHI